MSETTTDHVTFGHLAQSNWHKAEALRLDEENIKLHRRLREALDLLERCYAPDAKTADERTLLLKREEDRW